MTSRVQLAVYDLSMGMSAAMSQQILGIHVPIIPHTGVVVFGIEYFFGGGIQKLPFGTFSASNNMQPVQMLDVGATSKSKHDLEAFLRSINHQYTQQTYNLLTHNCNNFSNCVLEFLNTTSRVPSYILDLPSTVMSTPLGRQLLGPMMSSFQNQPSAFGGDPFASMGAGFASTSNGSSLTYQSQSSQGGGGIRLGEGASAHSGSASYQASAAASISATSSPPVASSTSSSSSSSSSYAYSPQRPPPNCKLPSAPSISSDASCADSLAQKLCKLQTTTESPLCPVLKEDEVKQLMETVEIIKKRAEVVGGSDPSSLLPSPPSKTLDISYFEKILKFHPAGHVASLFIIRLLVLQSNVSLFPRDAIVSLLKLVVSKLEVGEGNVTTDNNGVNGGFESTNAKVMAFTVLANALSHPLGVELLFESALLSERILDLTLRSITQPQTQQQVKHMASALLLNLSIICTGAHTHTHTHTTENAGVGVGKGWIIPGSSTSEMNGFKADDDEVHSHAVQLLCGCLDGAMTEADALVRKRRLNISLLLIRAYGSTAATLGKDLGFLDPLVTHLSVITSTPSTSQDLESEEAIIRELAYRMTQ